VTLALPRPTRVLRRNHAPFSIKPNASIGLVFEDLLHARNAEVGCDVKVIVAESSCEAH
jgi:hypothetical protein